MKTMTVSNIHGRSILLNLDRNLILILSEIKITSKSKIKTLLAAAALAGLLWPALAAEISLETAPPVVVKTVPLAGATEVDAALTEIKVTYSKAMQDGSWSWSTWGDENFPELVGEPKYLTDGRTCVVQVKLQPGKFYATWLNSDKFNNFKDASGQPAVPYLLTFRTRELGGAGGVKAEKGGRKFVRVVLDDQQMTFEGAPSTWERLDALLSAVPDRDRTVLEWGVPSTQITIQQQNEWSARFAQLARQKGFEYSSYVGVHPFGSKGGMPPGAQVTMRATMSDSEFPTLLNEDQRAVVVWTDRQFRSFFDNRTFDGWSVTERAELEIKFIDALKGPRSQDYYRAINTLGALRSTKALPELRGIAFERVSRNNRDRWMCVRALGLIGDMTAVPDLIHLVYHGNVNTRWWAQISLVRITGQNFGKDWNAWGKWWNDQKGEPPYKPEIVRWWDGQAEPDKLAQSLEESDQKFFADLQGNSTANPTGSARGL